MSYENQEKTLVIIAGGTIEALYSPEDGTPYNVPSPESVEDSAIPEALKRIGVHEQCDIYPLCIVDSKDITEDHLKQMVEKITTGGYKKVVVVQGTDTMPENGRYVDWALSQQKIKDITVVFTGAMNPLRDEHGNWHDEHHQIPQYRPDGLRNLRRAFEDAQQEKPGVYLEMGRGPWNVWEVNKKVDLRQEDKVDEPGQKVDYVAHSGFMIQEQHEPNCSLLHSWIRRYDRAKANAEKAAVTLLS